MHRSTLCLHRWSTRCRPACADLATCSTRPIEGMSLAEVPRNKALPLTSTLSACQHAKPALLQIAHLSKEAPMNDAARFDQADPLAISEQMRPDQRTAIANEFVRYLTLADDPVANVFRRQTAANARHKAAGAARSTWSVDGMAMLSAAEVTRIHVY